MPQLFTNFAGSKLTSSISDLATSLTVEAGKADLFPPANTGTNPVPAVSNWFKLTIEDAMGAYEIVYVRTRNAGSGVMSNLIRGREGTVAQAWAAGANVGLRITAADVEASIAAASNSVLTSGNQVVGGVKTFADPTIFQQGLSGNLTGDVIGDVSGNAGTVTNGVYTEGDQTIDGVKTFSSSPVVPTAPKKTANTNAASTAFVDGMRSLLNSTSAGTLEISDRGCHKLINSNVIVPSGVFGQGDVVVLDNQSSGNLTIIEGANIAMWRAGTTQRGNRTLGPLGVCSIIFASSSSAKIYGAGLS
jgi:hypothetical protein